MPGNIPWRGVSIPVVPVIGAVLTAVLWVTSLATHGGALIAGPVWLAIGVVVYLVSRRAGGESLLGRATPAVPDLVAAPEHEMRTILVPLKLSNVGEEVLATAIKLAEEREAEVRVLCVVKVPLSQPLDAVSDEDEARARAALEEVREIAEEQGVELQARLVRARSLSEAIIAEAHDVGADAIVLGSAPRWRSHKRFFSPTVDEVLRGAPCEVMVVTYPEGVLAGRRKSHDADMNAIVVGVGASASTLAQRLAGDGWEVTVIELERGEPRAAGPGLAPPAGARARHGREGARGGRHRRGRRGDRRDRRRQHQPGHRPGRHQALLGAPRGRADPGSRRAPRPTPIAASRSSRRCRSPSTKLAKWAANAREVV